MYSERMMKENLHLQLYPRERERERERERKKKKEIYAVCHDVVAV